MQIIELRVPTTDIELFSIVMLHSETVSCSSVYSLSVREPLNDTLLPRALDWSRRTLGVASKVSRHYAVRHFCLRLCQRSGLQTTDLKHR